MQIIDKCRFAIAVFLYGKTSEYLKGIVLNLPESPGIYQYLNTEGVIIYVGKAKNLKRRVSSYFKLHFGGQFLHLLKKHPLYFLRITFEDFLDFSDVFHVIIQ